MTGWGQPTAAELAAIVAAVELVWPRPPAPAPALTTGANRWRFSGRWWNDPDRDGRPPHWYGTAKPSWAPFGPGGGGP